MNMVCIPAGQAHHPIDRLEQIYNTLLVPVPLIQKLGQTPFRQAALVVFMPGLLRQQMRGGHQCEGILVQQQLIQAIRIVMQFDNRKNQPHLAAEQRIGK